MALKFWLAPDGRLWSGPHAQPPGLKYAVFAGFSRLPPNIPIWVHNTLDIPEGSQEIDHDAAEAEIMSYWPPDCDKNQPVRRKPHD